MIWTSRELVIKALEMRSPERIPRQLWLLPWAEKTYPTELAALRAAYPDDIVQSPAFLAKPLVTQGDEYEPGQYIDEWGCRFESKQAGIIGEVKQPILVDWKDYRSVRIPQERLSVRTDRVDEFCAQTNAFVLARLSVAPFERLQFIRRSDNLYLDLAEQPDELFSLLGRIHGFFKQEMELWASTDVDALYCADDWGSQKSLLISPDLWRRVFKPIYQDYADIAHRSGKYLFMHSDGYIVDILPDLIEVGVDAVNSQVFCMDIEDLAQRFAGKVTFWGEIDRQHLLPYGTPGEVEAAVFRAGRSLYRQGGVIAQCEFGIGARPENVAAVFESWNRFLR